MCESYDGSFHHESNAEKMSYEFPLKQLLLSVVIIRNEKHEEYGNLQNHKTITVRQLLTIYLHC